VRTVSSCPACASHATTVAATLDTPERRKRYEQFSQAKYGGLLTDALADVAPAVLRCTECGHCWYRQQPEPEQLGRMYAAGRPLFADIPRTREPSQAMSVEMVRLRGLVGPQSQAPTLLDYGSGYGRWARAAVQAGFQVTAFEPSAERGAEGHAPFELVHSLDALKGRCFTAIHLEQVLEHVPDPLQALQDLRSFCEAGAVVRITVPNLMRTPEGRALWDHWPFDGRTPHTMAPFEHLHGFTPRSLRRLLQRAGFRPLGTARLLRHYPAVPARSLLGRAFPRLGTTLQLVSAC
jgi:SAM-dependent methyltransferase